MNAPFRRARVPYRVMSGVLVAGVGLPVWLVGCQANPPHVNRTVNAPTFDDITSIKAFIRPKPWLNFDPSNPARINGLAINMYLISASRQKGVFGSGTIHVVLHEALAEGKSGASDKSWRDQTGEKIHEWVLPPDKAMMYRVIQRPDKTYVMGEGYQLRLSWGDKDLSGKHVAVVLEYHREDGTIVRRKPTWFKIPETS